MEYAGQGGLAWHIPDAVIVSDGEGTVRWGNAAAERLFGMSLAEGIGQNAFDYVHPDDAGTLANALVTVRAKEIGTPLEVRLRAADGWRLVEMVGANLLEDPAVGGIVISIRDLTERRRWEVARDEVSRFRALVHNASTIIALLDASGRVQSVSAAVTRLLGHDQEEVEGHPLAELVVEEDRPALAAILARAGTGADRPRPERLAVRMVAADGSDPVPFELHVVDLLDDPTVNGLVVSAHDVSELRRSMDQLAAAQGELARKERLAAVGRLASMVGHELRNPLAAITNVHYIVRHHLEDAGGPEVDRQLALAERETKRALRLVDELNDYVRPRRPNLTVLTLSSVVDELLETTPPPTGVDVELDLEPFTVSADAGQLRQILTNLVINSYEALGDGGTVRIVARRRGGYADIAVEDDGPGVDSSVCDRLFEPFVTTKARGSGLGLAIVQRLVDDHGGDVTLAPRTGGGTTATIRLPLTPGANGAQ